MPNRMKAVVSTIVFLLVGGLTLWNRSPLHSNMVGYVVMLAIGVVIVMWIFPNVRR